METTSLVSTKPAWLNLFRRAVQVFKKDSKTLYYNYHDIPLQTYLKIIETNDLKHLVIKGKLTKQATIIWETITRENEKHNGGNTYDVLLNLFKGLGELISEYNEIRITLWSLMKRYDKDLVESMREKGFDIDDTNSETYRVTLLNCIQRSNNYATRIKMKRNEIELETPEEKEVKQVSFEELIANLSMHLSLTIPSDITLALFNAYHKEIKNGRARRTDREE